MVYDKARELAKMISESEEYKTFCAAKEEATKNETTVALLKDYHQLQIKAQAEMVSGTKDDSTMERLKKIGELLQMNNQAAEYLMAEYRLNRMVGDIYRIIAEAIDADLGMLDT